MEYIRSSIAVMIILTVHIVVIGLYMKFANHIGETFRLGDNFLNIIVRKTKKK